MCTAFAVSTVFCPRSLSSLGVLNEYIGVFVHNADDSDNLQVMNISTDDAMRATFSYVFRRRPTEIRLNIEVSGVVTMSHL